MRRKKRLRRVEMKRNERYYTKEGQETIGARKAIKEIAAKAKEALEKREEKYGIRDSSKRRYPDN